MFPCGPVSKMKSNSSECCQYALVKTLTFFETQAWQSVHVNLENSTGIRYVNASYTTASVSLLHKRLSYACARNVITPAGMTAKYRLNRAPQIGAIAQLLIRNGERILVLSIVGFYDNFRAWMSINALNEFSRHIL